jgi:hypothetical protein
MEHHSSAVLRGSHQRKKNLSLAKIKSAREINNIQRRCVTCPVDEDRLARSFAEGLKLLFQGVGVGSVLWRFPVEKGYEFLSGRWDCDGTLENDGFR